MEIIRNEENKEVLNENDSKKVLANHYILGINQYQ